MQTKKIKAEGQPAKKTRAGRPGVADTVLRKKAEQRLKTEKDRLRLISSTDLKKLVHELGTHQIELEMQNDELRRVQGELESSRDRYADLYDFSPMGYFTFDRNGLIKEVNFTGAGMLGVPKRQLINKPAISYLRPEHRTSFLDHLHAVFKTQTRIRCEVTFITKDGTSLPVQLHSISYAAGSGNPGACRTAAIDVTERTLAETELMTLNETLEQRVSERTEALREKEQKLLQRTQELEAARNEAENERQLLTAVMEALPTGMAITDIRGGNVRVNAVYERIWAGPRPAVRSVEDYAAYQAWWVDTGKPIVPEEWASALAVQKDETIAGQLLRIRRFDGSDAYVINSASPVRDAKGNIVGSAVAIQDITNLKLTEEALRESSERMRLFIEHAPASLAMFDRDMRYIAVSNRWRTDYGLGDRNVLGRLHYEIFPDIPDRWREAHRRGLSGEVMRSDEDRFDRGDGSIQWLRWEIRPWRSADGQVGGIVIFTEDITDQKKAEEQLKATVARFHSILSSMYSSILLVSAEGRVEYANQAFVDMFGLPEAPADLSGLSSPEMIDKIKKVYLHADDEVKRIKDIVNQGRPVIGEEVFLQGGRTCIRDFIPLYLEGKPYGRVWHHQDITERKRAEVTLAESDQRERERAGELAALLDAAPTPVFIAHDPDCLHITGNRAADLLLKIPRGAETSLSAPEEYKPRHFRAMKDGRELRNDELPAQRAARGYPVQDFEFSIVFDDHEIRHVVGYGTPLLDDAGRPRGAVHVLVDITKRKQTEEALNKSMQRLALLSSTADELLRSTEPQASVASVCRKIMEHIDCRVFFNFLVDEQAGKLRLNAFAGIPEQEAKKLEWLDYGTAVCGCVARDGKRIVAESIPSTPDERTELVRSYGVKAYACHPLIGPGEKVIGTLSFGAKNRETFSDDDLYLMKATSDMVAIAMNRLNNEHALLQAHTELERRAYELEAVNRELEAFSYTVSHDLKAPLRSIEGFSSALLEDYAALLDATGKDYLNRVSTAAQRMNQFIEAMLNMAKVTRGELQEQVVDLSSLAQVIAHDLRKQAPERKVEFVIAEKIKVNGDRAMLQAVVENLMHNAWKFTGHQAEARIEFGVRRMPISDVGLQIAQNDMKSGPLEPDSEIRNQQSAITRTVYYVRDNGIGFDMKFSDKLFQPFKRLHADTEFPGLGIGLATANRIILRHNGRLWAESEPGKGATFYFTL